MITIVMLRTGADRAIASIAAVASTVAEVTHDADIGGAAAAERRFTRIAVAGLDEDVSNVWSVSSSARAAPP